MLCVAMGLYKPCAVTRGKAKQMAHHLQIRHVDHLETHLLQLGILTPPEDAKETAKMRQTQRSIVCARDIRGVLLQTCIGVPALQRSDTLRLQLLAPPVAS